MDFHQGRELLGVDLDASPREVKAAYRKALKQWHPDRFAGNPERSLVAAEETRRIIAAYRVLSGAPSESLTADQPDSEPPGEVPTFWSQLNPFHSSHYRYTPNTIWDGVAITGIIVLGIILLVVLGT